MSKPLRLGIAGLGTVGAGVIKILNAHGAGMAQKTGRVIEITGVSARDKSKDRGVDISRYHWFDDAQELATSPDIDVFVEMIGGDGDPARSAVEAALVAGKHVVTANKALIAIHGSALAKQAEEQHVALNFEAGVAGGIPIIKVLRENLASNAVSGVYGILNGTCNYILTVMEKTGRDFASVLKDAQDQGYAEADPSFDIGGIDAAHKLAILTSLAFGTELAFDQVYIEGIEKIALEDLTAASELGYKIKLLGVALDSGHGIEQRVHPALVPKDRPISGVDDVFNAVVAHGDFLGEIMLQGKGAGEGPTASAVMADILDIARGIILPPFGMPIAHQKPFEHSRMRAHEGEYYLRLLVHDKPGAVAAITQRMAEQDISLDSIVQKGQTGVPKGARDVATDVPALQVVLITHETTEASIRKSLQAITEDGFISLEPAMIRIEKT